ncbi:MAG: hypothetical protein QOG94_1188, partial [Solirubrobacteraceae bacterium]|nr:hypothetical protein [Solirubrobacteraceae bacterium]
MQPLTATDEAGSTKQPFAPGSWVSVPTGARATAAPRAASLTRRPAATPALRAATAPRCLRDWSTARPRNGPSVRENVRVMWPMSLMTSAPPITGGQLSSSHISAVRSRSFTLPVGSSAAASASRSRASALPRGRAQRSAGLRRRATAAVTQSAVSPALCGTSRSTKISSTEGGIALQARRYPSTFVSWGRRPGTAWTPEPAFADTNAALTSWWLRSQRRTPRVQPLQRSWWFVRASVNGHRLRLIDTPCHWRRRARKASAARQCVEWLSPSSATVVRAVRPGVPNVQAGGCTRSMRSHGSLGSTAASYGLG